MHGSAAMAAQLLGVGSAIRPPIGRCPAAKWNGVDGRRWRLLLRCCAWGVLNGRG